MQHARINSTISDVLERRTPRLTGSRGGETEGANPDNKVGGLAPDLLGSNELDKLSIDAELRWRAGAVAKWVVPKVCSY